MFSRIIFLTLLTFLFIALDYKKRVNLKKTLLSLAIYLFILSLGYVGYILMRIVAPLFFIHFILLIAAYLVLLWYLLRDRLYWQVLLLPVVTIIIYFVLNFIEGSRYETLNNIEIFLV